MKKVSLTHAERLEVSKILNTTKFKALADMAHALDDAKVVAHSADEIKAIGLEVINEGKNIKWNEDKVEKELELSDASVGAILDEIKKREEAGDITIADSNLITLQEKLK